MYIAVELELVGLLLAAIGAGITCVHIRHTNRMTDMHEQHHIEIKEQRERHHTELKEQRERHHRERLK